MKVLNLVTLDGLDFLKGPTRNQVLNDLNLHFAKIKSGSNEAQGKIMPNSNCTL